MRRKAIAAVWILGATVPALLATAFLVGCCVLPFHGVMHKLMPLCEMAATMVRGDHGGASDHEHDATPAPARQKDDSMNRVATSLPPVARLAERAATATSTIAAASRTAHRSFITLGAIRCDQDVGLHVFVELFRI